jgi:hypothetical protein
MKILLSTKDKVRKCKYGNFELVPDEGWELHEPFIDFESGLLVVSESLISRENLENDNGRLIIPSKDRIIDLEAIKQLSYCEWSRYFNYEPEESFSEDGRFKLVKCRVHDPQNYTDLIRQELIELNTGKVVASSTSVAFYNEKNWNLLERYYTHIRKQEEFEERLRNMSPEEKAAFEKKYQYFKERWDADSDDYNRIYKTENDAPLNECPQCGESFEEDCDECLRCGYVRKLK